MASETVNAAAEHVRHELAGEATGHDWHHSERVRKNALLIAEGEEVDSLTVELAALLHDVADPKTNDGDEAAGLAKVKGILTEIGVDADRQDHVLEIIATMSFSKTVDGQHDHLSIEAQVVQDADRLDSVGAIGIARAFAYGGKHGRPLHDPDVDPKLPKTSAEYAAARTTTFNHFYDKHLLLKDRMNTETARQIAEGRHAFTEAYMEQFLAEWEGKR